MNRAERRRQKKLAKTATKRGSPELSASSSAEKQVLKVQHSLETAVQHHNAGRLLEAEEIYQQILQSDPNQPIALHLLGVVAHQTKRNDVAVDLISKALAIKPVFAEAHNNLGSALKDLGKLDEAAASYRTALSINPDYAEAHYNLGIVLQGLGKLGDAASSYEKALSNKPDLAKAHNNLGTVFKELGKLSEAIDHYHKALANQSEYAEAHNNLGVAFQLLGRFDEAVDNYRKALGINPDFVEAYNNLGNALRELGRMDEALINYRKALSISPDFAEAHRHLALTKNHPEFDEDIRAMERVYGKNGISDTQRMHLAFGLGKAFEDLHRYEEAFEFFVVGNALRRKEYSYSVDAHASFFKKLKEAFDETFLVKHQGAGHEDKTPIFIVGMPRSGTTLVEQILASHPEVHGAGELMSVSQVFSEIFGTVDWGKFSDNVLYADDDAFKRLGVGYIEAARHQSENAKIVVDKHPNNYFFLGAINLALPHAKVIHCVRSPADTGLSIFKSYFPNEGSLFAYDMLEIGEYFNLYSDLMQHWHKLIPGFVHDTRYEDKVANQEEQTRSLLEYCELEWSDSCLTFFETDRPVMTASAAQVRRPIYKDSVQLWKRYETQLTPLLECLRKQ